MQMIWIMSLNLPLHDCRHELVNHVTLIKRLCIFPSGVFSFSANVIFVFASWIYAAILIKANEALPSCRRNDAEARDSVKERCKHDSSKLQRARVCVNDARHEWSFEILANFPLLVSCFYSRACAPAMNSDDDEFMKEGHRLVHRERKNKTRGKRRGILEQQNWKATGNFRTVELISKEDL